MRPGHTVFGIGLSRTGTTSLTEALRLLGYKSIHFPLSILSYRAGIPTVNPRAVERFDALTDTPVALLYRELDAAFPRSKFILTTREPGAWLASMRRLRLSYLFLRFVPKIRRLTEDLYGPAALSDEAALTEHFTQHEAAVRAYFGDRLGKDLLILDVSTPTAWRELTAFLDRPDIPGSFPHQNRAYRTTFANLKDLFDLK